MEKKLIALALFLVALAATVTAQTQVLSNPEFNGCVGGDYGGYSASPWTGGPGTFSFATYAHLFNNEPPGDSCFYVLRGSPDNQVTQSNINLAPSYYDFEMFASCNGGNAGGTCTYSLTINGANVPLSTSVFSANFPTTLYSITATDIYITSSPATLVLTSNIAGETYEAYFAHATLTLQPDGDHDGVLSTFDNCPLVYNPSQADYDHDGVGDACECNPDTVNPIIECRPSVSVTLSVPPFSSTVLPSTPVSLATDNCVTPTLSLDKSFFTLRDTLAPVSIKATATDGYSKTASCSTSVQTRMIGSILTNPASSLLSLPRGRQMTLGWTTNVSSFSSSDSVTIKVVTLAGTTAATVVNGVRFTDGGAAVTFSASLSNISTYKLNIFLNGNIPAGSHTIKFA